MSRKRPTTRQRQTVSTRAKGLCEYCFAPKMYSNAPFVVEHIHPVAHGGLTELDNLAYACIGCNGHKSDKLDAPDPHTGASVPLFHPRRQHWHEHFAWNDDETLILGLTPTGRATIAALELNRTELLNLRAVLVWRGKHPPEIG